MNFKDKVSNLLLTGSEVNIPVIVFNDQNVKDATNLLIYTSINEPGWLLGQIFILNNSMTIMVLAILCTNAPSSFLDKTDIKDQMVELLLLRDSEDLLMLAEYLKSKYFGKGLGARPQKLIRRVMEAWDINMLQENINKYPKEVFSLIKLIHPRYNGNKGDLIKKLLNR